ncbi:MAG: hypothetical protein MZU91_11140 [Desulfosudis oleivorans]|nr:hypothetical protein [Desulfosudis oleivorans]
MPAAGGAGRPADHRRGLRLRPGLEPRRQVRSPSPPTATATSTSSSCRPREARPSA